MTLWRGVALGLAIALVWQPAYVFACAVTGVQAYQASSAEIGAAMELAALGRLGAGYPELPPLETGYPTAGAAAVPVPCVLVKAIGFIESSWRQAAGSVPVGSAGAVKQSPSCGYGVMQITTGMRQPAELPAEVQQRIAADYRYNIAWGTRMLAEKWNAMDYLGAVVGDRNPAVAEHWYYSVWAYNQFNFRNNPNNPDYPWPRTPYDGSQPKTHYPFQELVWGLAAHPPKEGGVPLWNAVPLSLPDREAIGGTPGVIPAPPSAHAGACPALAVEPGSLSLTVPPAGLAPVTQRLSIGAGRSSSVPWQVRSGAPWIAVSPAAGGSLPAQIAVTVDPRALPPGPHEARITITAEGLSPVVVPIRVQVEGGHRTFVPYLPRRPAVGR